MTVKAVIALGKNTANVFNERDVTYDKKPALKVDQHDRQRSAWVFFGVLLLYLRTLRGFSIWPIVFAIMASSVCNESSCVANE
jgi:hypothetical protein